MRNLSLAVAVCVLGLIHSGDAHAQSVQALRDRLQQAETDTSLDGPTVTPWHLKIALELLNAKGETEQVGTYEEWWMAADRYRTTYDFPAAKVTELHNEHGTFRTREAAPVPGRARELVDGVVHPITVAKDVPMSTPELRKQEFGKVQYDCIMLAQPLLHTAFAPVGLFPTYCFAPDTHALIAAFPEGAETISRSRMGTFQNKNVAVGLTLTLSGTALAKASVTELKTSNDVALHLVDDPELEPEQSGPTTVQGSVVAGKILTKVAPVYPDSAKKDHIAGQVLLHCIIGRDGRVRSLRIISAPSADLAISSLIAVRQWTYKPYLLNGEPTEVDTTVTVNFTFGPR